MREKGKMLTPIAHSDYLHRKEVGARLVRAWSLSRDFLSFHLSDPYPLTDVPPSHFTSRAWMEQRERRESQGREAPAACL